ncbi:MAG: hypothetical protein D6786_04825 [Gammaproteobacteria bacterium]|nr:MAG: hypothetical protein D6786_04825 [Gammaproteobacteria bacterium]
MNGHELTWGLPVIGYLFLAGMGAGALTTSASMYLRGGASRDNRYFSLAKFGALLGVPTVAIGCALLVFELGSFQVGHWFRFLNLYKVMNLSPMSVGTWLLTFYLVVGALYAYTFLRQPAGEDGLAKLRTGLAWFGIPLGIGVAVYTGVLLGAMPARPLWNSPILAFLFLISSLSTGIAAIMLLRRAIDRDTERLSGRNVEQQKEAWYILASTDTLLLALELISLFLFLMYGHLTIGSVKHAISVLEFGGQMSGMFWFWVVLVGLLLPILIELYLITPRLLFHRPERTSVAADYAVPILVLVGGFMLRYVIVVAGQITYPIGL